MQPSSTRAIRSSRPSAARLRYPRAPEVITVPAEPGTAPPPAWSAMLIGLNDATRSACSALRASLSPYPDPDGRSGVCHAACEEGACGTPTPSLIARADVARNVDADRPRYQTPA